MNTTSLSLLEQVRGGPKGLAWERWHALYEPLIRGWLASQGLKAADDRDDVAQDVLTVVVRRLPEFQHNGNTGAFRNWLKTISINCLRDYWKKQANHKQAAKAMQTLDEWADPDGALSRVWDREHDKHVVRKLLALLKPDFEEETWIAFEKLVLNNEEPAEVARTLKTTVNSVYIAKSRVLRRLRQEAEGLVDDPFS